MKKTIIILTVLAIAASGMSQPLPEDQSSLENFKTVYNNQTEEVPSFLGNIVGGETINIRFKDNGTTETTIGTKFDGLKIENISDSSLDDPTMKVNVSRNAINSIVQSGQPYQELRNQLDKENIDYETTTTGAGIKFTILETLDNIASAIGLNF